MRRRGDPPKPAMTDVKETLGPTKTERLTDPRDEYFFGDSTAAENADAPKEDAATAAALDDEEVRARREYQERKRFETDKPIAEQVESLAIGNNIERVITHMFRSIDTYQTYQDLRGKLRFKGRASALGLGEILDALNDAQQAAYDAAELVAQAKSAHDEFELHAKVIAGAMRKEALDVLNQRKAELKAETKTSGKVISNDDVEAEIASTHPDEWADLEIRRGRARRGIALLEALEKDLIERAKDLRAMYARSRAVE